MKLSILFGLLLTGCASLSQPVYTWNQVYQPATHTVYYTIDNPNEYKQKCGERTIACSILYIGKHCEVYSMLSPLQMEWRKDWDGMSIKEHEDKHCAGWIHNEPEMR